MSALCRVNGKPYRKPTCACAGGSTPGVNESASGLISLSTRPEQGEDPKPIKVGNACLYMIIRERGYISSYVLRFEVPRLLL